MLREVEIGLVQVRQLGVLQCQRIASTSVNDDIVPAL